jgi:hypothetical protein
MLLKAFLCMQQLSIFCDLFFSAFFLMQVFLEFLYNSWSITGFIWKYISVKRFIDQEFQNIP